MSRLTDLLRQVEGKDRQLAEDLRREFEQLSKRRAFGLNFERHVPETVELPERPVRRGDKVRFLPERGELPGSVDRRLWLVTGFAKEKGHRIAKLARRDSNDHKLETATRTVDDLVVVAEFRDPIFPGLRSTGRVERGGDKPFHTVINAENYHALQALLYTHEGKVDAIYIDPPYNTRDKDWKYNNDYVDSDDQYKHSKWLAMMERRLRLAKRLLNPLSAVLIVTIDANEMNRLALLLEQTFPAARVRMISTVINPKGVGVSEGFKRVDEYIFIARLGSQSVTSIPDVPLGSKPADTQEVVDTGETSNDSKPSKIGLDWQTARRRDLQSVRHTRPAQFYPIYVNERTGMIEAIGDPIPHNMDRHSAPKRQGCVAVFPVRDDDTEMNWGVTAPTFFDRWKKGYARAGRPQPGKPQPYIIQYLKTGPIKDIEEGRAVVEGRNPDGSVIAYYEKVTAKSPPTQWNLRSHNAEHYGTKVLRALLPGRIFPFPKSLYAVEDVLRLFVMEKPKALIVDFFAGSGTTAHAVLRLNKQDGGRRQCISVTNNEVSADEQKALREKGLRPGDSEWEALGICEYITQPRLEAAITGRTPEGEPIKGTYKFTDEFPMAKGFEENVEYFKLTYEAPRPVAHHRSFEAIAPLLWLKAGAQGRRIENPAVDFDIAEAYSILFDLDHSQRFITAVNNAESVRMAFIITDDDRGYQSICAELPARVEAVRLYESYLSNFIINTGRE